MNTNESFLSEIDGDESYFVCRKFGGIINFSALVGRDRAVSMFDEAVFELASEEKNLVGHLKRGNALHPECGFELLTTIEWVDGDTGQVGELDVCRCLEQDKIHYPGELEMEDPMAIEHGEDAQQNLVTGLEIELRIAAGLGRIESDMNPIHPGRLSDLAQRTSFEFKGGKLVGVTTGRTPIRIQADIRQRELEGKSWKDHMDDMAEKASLMYFLCWRFGGKAYFSELGGLAEAERLFANMVAEFARNGNTLTGPTRRGLLPILGYGLEILQMVGWVDSSTGLIGQMEIGHITDPYSFPYLGEGYHDMTSQNSMEQAVMARNNLLTGLEMELRHAGGLEPLEWDEMESMPPVPGELSALAQEAKFSFEDGKLVGFIDGGAQTSFPTGIEQFEVPCTNWREHLELMATKWHVVIVQPGQDRGYYEVVSPGTGTSPANYLPSAGSVHLNHEAERQSGVFTWQCLLSQFTSATEYIFQGKFESVSMGAQKMQVIDAPERCSGKTCAAELMAESG